MAPEGYYLRWRGFARSEKVPFFNNLVELTGKVEKKWLKKSEKSWKKVKKFGRIYGQKIMTKYLLQNGKNEDLPNSPRKVGFNNLVSSASPKIRVLTSNLSPLSKIPSQIASVEKFFFLSPQGRLHDLVLFWK